LVARNRMSRHELRQAAAERLARGKHDVLLRAAGVGDNGAAGKCWSQRRQRLPVLRDRYRNQHEIGAGHLARPIVVEHYAAIDHASRNRAPEVLLRAADADNLANGARRAHGEGTRGTDQSDADDDEFFNAHGRYRWKPLAPLRAPQESVRFPRACRPSRAAMRASRNWPPGARSRPGAAMTDKSPVHPRLRRE